MITYCIISCYIISTNSCTKGLVSAQPTSAQRESMGRSHLRAMEDTSICWRLHYSLSRTRADNMFFVG